MVAPMEATRECGVNGPCFLRVKVDSNRESMWQKMANGATSNLGRGIFALQLGKRVCVENNIVVVSMFPQTVQAGSCVAR